MKILLVDDEEQVLRGISRMIESEMDCWEVTTATSGTEALGLLDSSEFNVIVSDMRMPGMDGAQLLEHVEERFPNILRVVLSGHADRDTVLRAVRPMHQYLAKPCDAERLVDMVKRAEALQETISSSDVLEAIGRANCLPSLPKIVNEINQELEHDTCTAKSIATVIEQDPILCAKILQLANSAIFGQRNPVVEVERGVAVVGTEIIRSLAMSLAVFTEGQHEKVLSASKLFDHSYRVAVLARSLAVVEKLGSDQINSVFSTGLLHDAGKIVLLNAFPERYSQVLQRSASEQTPICQVEFEEFGAAHQGVGAYLLELWGVPAELVENVSAHHSFDICSRGSTSAQIAYGANWIVNGGDEGEFERLVEEARAPELADQFLSKLRAWKKHATSS